MGKILLDYFFKITPIEPTPAASTAFLKQVLAVVKPKVGAVEDTITLCTSKTAVDAFSTTAVEVDELFDAGMTRVYVIAVDALDDLGDFLDAAESQFYTVLISADFSDAEVDAADFGSFEGVIGYASDDGTKNTTRAATENFCAFYSTDANRGKNMFAAFGALLSNASNWLNQQYITMEVDDGVDTVGEADALFDDKVSFAISDDEFGKRLALFAAGGKAIVAPYIKKNLMIDMQSAALSFVSGNQPAYNLKNAALLEDELQQVVDSYIERELITDGTVEISLVEDNFVANGDFNIAEPKALWRIAADIRQTL